MNVLGLTSLLFRFSSVTSVKLSADIIVSCLMFEKASFLVVYQLLLTVEDLHAVL